MLDLTPFLKGYAAIRRRQLQRQNAVETQRRALQKLIRRAQSTKFGRDHNFSKIHSVEDYQAAVPLRTYEDFWSNYWKTPFPRLNNCTWPGEIPYFAVSSGTSSGTTKYIPLSHEMLRSNSKAALDVLVHHLTRKPRSRLLGGMNFMLGGSTALKQEAPGISSGDLSGITVKELPWWIAPRYFPGKDLALLSNWEEKIQKLAEESLRRDIRTISGVPSWMLIFIDKLAELRPDLPRRLTSYFPNLELVIHGGVNFTPYYEQFLELLEGSHAELGEVYPASEGFIAVGDRRYGDGLRLILDHGIFFEFVPVGEVGSENPTRHWVQNIEEGVQYAVVLTSCAGTWSYIIGDTVRFVDTRTPRLLVTGRTSYSLSAFGEHLIAEEVEDAVHTALLSVNLQVNDYSVGALYPKNPGELGGHLYILEVSDQHYHQALTDNSIPEQLAARIDERLCERNEDYDAHRAKGYGLRAPEVRLMPHGFFADWMKSRGKLGGQNKVPRLISKPELFDNLRQFSDTYPRP